MPDGVLALTFGGMSSESPFNTGTAAPIEEVWRKVVASARLMEQPVAPQLKVQVVSQ